VRFENAVETIRNSVRKQDATTAVRRECADWIRRKASVQVERDIVNMPTIRPHLRAAEKRHAYMPAVGCYGRIGRWFISKGCDPNHPPILWMSRNCPKTYLSLFEPKKYE